MSKMTNIQTFKRFGHKGKTMMQAMNDKFLEHIQLTASPPFCYRAAFANRPTPPRKRFIG